MDVKNLLVTVPHFEETMTTPIAGVTTDVAPIAKTARMLGISVPGPVKTATMTIKIKNFVINPETGVVDMTKFHKASNDSRFTFADIEIIDTPVIDHKRVIKTYAVNVMDLPVKYHKDGSLAAESPQRVRLNTDKHGQLKRNTRGTFAPEYHVLRGGKGGNLRNDIFRIHNHTLRTIEGLGEYAHRDMAAESQLITGGNVTTPEKIKLEGFRIFVYRKTDDNGSVYFEISVATPNVKRTSCPRCSGKIVDTKTKGFISCTSCGFHGKRYVEKYEGYMLSLAKRMLPAVEYAFLSEGNIPLRTRGFSARCSSCSNCQIVSYGNQEDPAVRCRIGMTPDLVFEHHWEQDLDRDDRVVLGSNVYLLYSQQEDDITCLPKSAVHMKSPTASNRGGVGYEIPRWLTSTQKLNDLLADLSIAFVQDACKGKTDGYKAEFVAWYLKNYVMEVEGTIFDEESTDVELAFARSNGSDKYEVMTEQDRLPDMDRVHELLKNVHPFIKNLILEGTMGYDIVMRDLETDDIVDCDPWIYDPKSFTLTRQVFQNAMMAEPGLRMIKDGRTDDYMASKFERDACIWFSYKDSRYVPHGLAHMNAKLDRLPNNVKGVLPKKDTMDNWPRMPYVQPEIVTPKPVTYEIVGGCRVPVINND